MTANRPRARTRPRGRRRDRRRWVWLVVGVVVVIGIALVIASVAGRSEHAARSGAAPASLVHRVTSVPVATTDAVGTGGVTRLPKAIDGAALTRDGLPTVVYIGAEYCPYCAAERWALIQALSRFGTFRGLRTTASSSTDIFPGTPTFSFHGSRYTSPYVGFESVEQQGSELSGGEYPVLETPTPEQERLLATYDAPPYVPASSTGAIPFIDLGGRYLITGASYSPELLAGRSRAEIAAALHDPDDPIARAVLGTANGMTAAICSLTNQQPASVCNTTIRQIESSIS